VKKRPVAIDVDDVLADFIGATLGYVHSQTGVRVPRSAIKTWVLTDHVPPEISDHIVPLWKSKGFCAMLPPLRGAVDAIGLLRDTHKVTFVTAPLSGGPWWVEERRRWLMSHLGAQGKKDIVFTSDKHLLVKDYEVIVDDRSATVDKWADAGGAAIIVSQPHNVGFKRENVLRAPDIVEAVYSLRRSVVGFTK